MNFKIEIKYLDIINYPSVERYLESMASKGWLINKIIVGNIFIFKKIEPQELDFSISPYEIETAFTRKSKEELDEFKDVTQSVGWTYCTKSYNLHIYYKKKNAEILAIHTDVEEEFELLESLGKSQLRGYYVLIPFLLFMSWMIIGRMTTSVYAMKDGMNQIIIPLLPVSLVLTITQLVHLKRFLKLNRENIKLGKHLEYSDSKFYMVRGSFAITFICLIVFVLYVLYQSIFLKNKIVLFALLPLSGIIIGQLFRKFIKPSKHSKAFKIVGFVITILAVVMISSWVGMIGVGNIGDMGSVKNTLDRDQYKVLLRSDFSSAAEDAEATLLPNTSILIPKSYEYISGGPRVDDISYIETEYSKALTKGTARELVNRYKLEEVRHVSGSYYPELEYSYETGEFDPYLIDRGLTMADFDRLKEKNLKDAIDESVEIIKEKMIVKADHSLWNVDEAYFLTHNKDKIVLRKDKEVFVLRGIDFTDQKIIAIAREKLRL